MDRVELAKVIFSMMPTMNRKIFRQLPQCDYPKQKLRLLHTVHHHNDESMSFYCEHLYISKPNLSKLVDSMIEEGLLERHQDKKDRRVTRIMITDEGNEIMKDHFTRMTENVAQLFEVFSDEEVEALNIHFNEIIKIFNKVK